MHKVKQYGFEKEKKQLKGLFLHVQFSVHAECFACASACTSYHKHLIGKPGYTGFHDNIWNSLLLFQIFRCNAPKNRAHLRGFELLSVGERHQASNLCRLEFKTILVQDIFYIFLCGLSIDFMKTVKAFWISFFGTLRVVLKQLVLSTLN